ncbi:RcnB family protein [Sphingomonas xinjiangensis]|uniref:Nickel/cobalt transporter regulator n=1 Tax=Sphingomonas xinjiangensis TaxID=643568 RepID=A0A840YJE9_9SPHN|nr:RcnB family protein [Sphingomonas xinjiangensis]MBB5712289.1 hypothetical protein [Sphingomonas xinjiangensis]
MKKTLFATVIAAMALVPPALAQDRDGRWGGGGRPAGDARPAPQQREMSRPVPSTQPGPQRQWSGAERTQGQWSGGARNGWSRQGREQGQQQAQREWNGGSRGEWRRRDGASQAQPLQSPGRHRSEFDRGNRSQGSVNPQQFRGGNDRWNNDRRNDRRWDSGNGFRGDRGGRWDNGWRNDRRYDWQGYRTQNRSLYRLPRYYAPSGWGYGYRRFTTGFRLSALLYASQYWINDPFNYRLPEVYGPYRWVRYYNDALLVDTYSGDVVDTIYDIFW